MNFPINPHNSLVNFGPFGLRPWPPATSGVCHQLPRCRRRRGSLAHQDWGPLWHCMGKFHDFFVGSSWDFVEWIVFLEVHDFFFGSFWMVGYFISWISSNCCSWILWDTSWDIMGIRKRYLIWDRRRLGKIRDLVNMQASKIGISPLDTDIGKNGNFTHTFMGWVFW